jgi:hypothetical protein
MVQIDGELVMNSTQPHKKLREIEPENGRNEPPAKEKS